MLFFRKRKNTDRKRSSQANHTRQHPTLARLRPLRCEPLEDRRMLSITLFVDDGATSGGDGLGWATAYDDLQSALIQAATLNADADATNDVDQIWIAEGTYKPTSELKTGYARTASFSLVDGVTLYGGFIGTETTLDARNLSPNYATILSGDLGVIDTTSDNAYTVVYCTEAVTAAIDGLSVVEGNANAGDGPLIPKRGGGIYCSGTLTIANSVITDNSATLYGGGIHNISGTITITNSIISNNTSADGGGIYNNSGTLTITDSTISDNLARNDGGGIYNDSGTLTISNLTLSGNSANFDGGGIYSNSGTLTLDNSLIQDNSANYNGGGIYGGSSVSITHSTFSGNSASNGGGIYGCFGETTITLSSFAHNSASSGGGGIYNTNANTLTINGSMISDNSATEGGGIHNRHELTIIDSTISSNLAIDGGGIYNLGTLAIADSVIMANSASFGGGIKSSRTLTLINSTITGNLASDGGGIHNQYELTVTNSTISGNSASRGGGIYQFDGTSTLANAIIAKNVASYAGPDMHYTMGTLAAFHSLISDGSESSLVNGVGGNQVGTSSAPIDPMLSSLTQFGNGLWGHYLLQGSPAIDAGSNALAVDENAQPLTEDMSGNVRIIGTNVDIGAVEGVVPSRPAQTYVITSLDETIASDGVLTFFEAFQAANSNQPVGDALAGSITERDTIQFASELFAGGAAGRILLDDGELVIVGDLSIEGPGSELLSFDAAMQNRVFTIASNVSVSLSGITVTGGLADTDTRLYYGGGIYNFGDLTLTDSVLSNNSARFGGAIYNRSGTLTLINSTITNNSANNSGGGIENSFGTATLTNCTLTGNSADGEGGGIRNAGGMLALAGCTVTGNSSKSGGGIFSTYATPTVLTIDNSVIANNSASSGGGIYCDSTTTVTNSTFVGNTATTGGGIYTNSFNTETFINNSIFWKNDGGDREGVGESLCAQNLVGIDPQFVDLDGGDYRLQASSPAINYGDNSLAVDTDGNPLTMDLEGNIRFHDTTVDCGAFEFQNTITAGRETPSLTVTTANDVFDLYDGQVSLREAIYYTDSGSIGTTVTFDATLNKSTITLLGESLFIDKSLTIDASALTSLTIDADSKSRVFMILTSDESEVTLKNLTITGGSAQNGGGIYNSSTLTLENCILTGNLASSNGGGMYNSLGTVTFTNSAVTNNSANVNGGGIFTLGVLAFTSTMLSGNSAGSGSGGGIYCHDGTTELTLTDCTLADNSADNKGGGIFSIASSDTTITLTISNSTLSGNSASEGGGIYCGSYSDGVVALALVDSTFSENTASKGGGIYNGYYYTDNYGIATVDITGCEFSRNSASNGGGIYNSTGTLTLTNSTLSGNSASYGGGIFNRNDSNEDATATTLINTTLADNSATTSGGGVYNGGYGDSVATLTILDCTLSGNSATYGGGILNQDVDENGATTLTITGTTLSNNTASQHGGGIYNYGQNNTATLTIANSIFKNNSSDYDGGGIYSYGILALANNVILKNSARSGGGIYNPGTLTLTNSILAGNSASSVGGGIYNSGTLTITNNTLLENSASGGGGIYSSGLSPTVILNNTIVAGNAALLNGPDILLLSGTLSGSHNLIGDGTDQTLVNGTDGNQVGATGTPLDPKLSTLTQFNNGLWGYYLLSGSPAIDAGDNSLALDPAGQPLAEDMDGNVRVIDSTVDIGAVEGVVPSSPGQIYIVTSLDETIANDGILTFLEAFQAANSNQPYGDALAGSITEPDMIQFDNALFADGVFKTIFIDDGELNIWGDLNIEGPGMELLTFDAAEQNRVFNIPSGISVNLDGVTITGGSTSNDGGGIYNNGTLTVTNSSVSSNSAGDDGGAVYNNGTLVIDGSLISDNISDSSGGGIYNNGILTATKSSFGNNSANKGGGIYNYNEATVVNVTFLNNSASYGGGIYNHKTLSVTSSTIASNAGSGLYLYGSYSSSVSSTVINNSIVANNDYLSIQLGDIASQWRVTVTGCNNLIGVGGYYLTLVDGVDGNQVGTSSLPLDPMLDEIGSPLSGSPAIDAGDNSLVPENVITDLDGNYRIVNGTVDIGAYEFASNPLLSGDANCDGKVDGSDVTIIAGNWQAGVAAGSPRATWSMGDFNGDGKIDGSDVTILAGNWQACVNSTVVAVSVPEEEEKPEPTTEPTPTNKFVPPINASLGVATVPRRESLPPHRLITPTPKTTDAALEESTWSEVDMTAIAKDLMSVSAKKSTAANDELFALEMDPYADFE